MMAGFDLNSVSKRYDGVRAVHDISFRIEPGENLAIIGPSGCGKSTTFRLLAGFEAPSTGKILLDGEVISEPGCVIVPPHRRHAAMVFQDLALWPNMSVLENVLLGLASKQLSKRDAQCRADEALALCKIEHLATRRPGQISGGQQQRVALARALAAQPRFLFLDEPFSGLDLLTKIMLLKDIAQLSEAKQITLILISHDPIEATRLCRSAVILNQGVVEEQGELELLMRAPRSEILRVFKESLEGAVAATAHLPGP